MLFRVLNIDSFSNASNSKLQFFSLIQSFLHKNLKGLVLHKAYLSQGLTPKYSLRNYCIFSGRSSGLYRKFNTSRIKLRDLSFSRMFTGLRKIS